MKCFVFCASKVKTEFRSSFARDLSAIKSKNLRKRIEGLIELVEQTPNLALVPNLKKLPTLARVVAPYASSTNE